MMPNIKREDERILVTGATGQHGGTGLHVVEILRSANVAVRVLARTPSERTARLEALGAEVVFGDYRDRRSLELAFAGITAASFTYPVAEGVVEAAAAFAAAARTLPAPPRIVVNSMAASHPQSPSHLGRAQWLAEEVLGWAGLSPVVLRVAAFFFENVSLLHGTSIRERGVIASSFGAARVPWIAGIDAARLLARALLDPTLFPPGVHMPPGVELASHASLAERLGVRYEAISPGEWREALLAAANGVINAGMAAHITALSGAIGKGPMVQPDAEKLAALLGRPPTTFAEFADASGLR